MNDKLIERSIECKLFNNGLVLELNFNAASYLVDLRKKKIVSTEELVGAPYFEFIKSKALT